MTSTDATRQALEVSAQPKEVVGVRDLILRNEPELQKLLGPSLTVEAFATAAMTYLRQNPAVAECDPFSVVGGLRLGAQLGLTLGPLGLFYLVPFNKVATFVLGYRGMVQLAYRSGLVKSVQTGIVREGDTFEHRKGTRPFLDHAEHEPPGDREWIAVYAVASLKTGGAPFEVLYPEQVEARRKRSASASKPASPWNTDTAAMWRKSAVRALAPMLPQTPALALALDADEAPVVDGLDVEAGES